MMSASQRTQGNSRVRGPLSPRPGDALTIAALPHDGFRDEAQIRALSYRGGDLTCSVAGVEVERCTFDAVRLADSELSRCIFSDSIFDQCDLANTHFDGSSLLKSRISGSRLTGSTWATGLLRDVSWVDCRADLARFRQMKLKAVTFVECNLRQSDFQWADLRHVTFEKCDLTGAQFANAQMESGVEFYNCDLYGVGGVTGPKGATVRGGDLVGLTESLAHHVGIRLEP